jgi:rod shape determining protein RodA
MIDNDKSNSLSLSGVDWMTVFIFLLLALIGWVSIYAAGYDETRVGVFNSEAGKQIVWIGVSVFIAVSILLIDDKYWHILAQPLYWLSILFLAGTFVFGVEVNAAKAWYEFGSFRIQPVEFVKISTALVLARVMSSYSFNIRQWRSVLWVFALIGLPVFIIVVLQNDMGSALVYGSFLFMLYREGLNGWIYMALILGVSLFILSFFVSPFTLLVGLIGFAVMAEGVMNGRWKTKIIYLASLALAALGLYFCSQAVGGGLSPYACLLICAGISLIPVIVYAYRHRLKNIYLILLLFIGSLFFTQATDYIFHHVAQPHQQQRILILFGLESDPGGAEYNVRQSKIAIGSGGLFGKGFLQGTQTQYDFVPEQTTDFIFCTIGEEWGFAGSLVIITLFTVLIFRLIAMGERQQEAFGRIYCYCVAGIFLFHLLINIGMTVGLMPVIGIPLPFVSYGGSSMMAFTILLFIAVKLDSAKKTHITRI